MSKLTQVFSRLNVLIEGRRRYFAIGGLLVVIVAAILLLRSNDDSIRTTDRPTAKENTPGGEASLEPGAAPSTAAGGPVAKATKSATGKRIPATTVKRENVGVAKPKSGTIPPGVDYANQVIKVTYYWDSSSSGSEHLSRTSAAQNAVDDGLAFQKLTQYINNHIDGSASLMGTQIKMGNWLIEPSIVTMNDADGINTGTAKITGELKPFASMSARSSMSATVCPAVAKVGIHNFATTSFVSDLPGTTNGYCNSGGFSWDPQVAATVNYMKWHRTTPFGPRADPACPVGQLTCPRVYGVLYTEYPGLAQQGPQLVTKLRNAGVNIPNDGVASFPEGLDQGARLAQGVRDKFDNAGVNTVIMPDGGSSLAFITAVHDWHPDYYVWPCSGQDTTGYTRLLAPSSGPGQGWDNAAGLSCYDDTFDADLTADGQDRASQWYAAYKEIAPDSEPPSSTYLVYAALSNIVVGVSNLEAQHLEFTVENFRAAHRAFQPFRYNGATGRTNDAENIMLVMGNTSDGSPWGDVARVEWSPGPEPFSYLGGHRYTANQSFP